MNIVKNEMIFGNLVAVKRSNNNDCWNVALALALNEDYNVVRKRLIDKATSSGGMSSRFTRGVALKNGYELMSCDYRTPKALAEDTKFTEYEYLVAVTGHIIYVRYGFIYDSFKSDLKRIRFVYRRKISKRRKPIHNLIEKGGAIS